MGKMVYLPLDERPCNYRYPQQLAAMTDFELSAPDIRILGDKKRPADAETVAEWLTEEAGDADNLLVSVDMLVYGGIVPSRLHRLPKEQCLRRLRLLERLKERNPNLRIYAFSLIMRVPAYSGSEEEPDYYANFGRELFLYGWYKDKSAQEPLDPAERQQFETIRRSIPPSVLADYLHRRGVNAFVNETVVDMTASGIIDFLVIPLDDNAEYGFSPMEQRRLALKT